MENEQAAFRNNKQINDNISTVRNLIEKAMDSGEQLYEIFIDLRAAFGRKVNRSLRDEKRSETGRQSETNSI